MFNHTSLYTSFRFVDFCFYPPLYIYVYLHVSFPLKSFDRRNAWGQLGVDQSHLYLLGDSPANPIAAPISFIAMLNTIPVYTMSFSYAHVCAFWNALGGKVRQDFFFQFFFQFFFMI